MSRCTLACFVSLLSVVAAWFGCGGGDAAPQPPGSTTTSWGDGGIGGTGAGGHTAGLGVGEPCTDTAECRSGLVCEEGVCAPGHTTAEGDPCTISGECEVGLYCEAGVCAPAGEGTDGDSCASDADCQSGYRCALVGLSAVCVPEGSVDVGGDCQTSEDCFGGLGCIGGACVVVPPGTPPFGELWPGIDCDADTTPVEAFFRVPRGTDDGDFYRLPMPNDVRLDAGQIDLSGHPTPGDGLLGYDIVDRYLRAIEQDNDGWGVYHSVYFRFSGPIDFDSLQGSVQLRDLTAGSGHGFSYMFRAHGNAYQCGNRFVMWPLPGFAYRPGHTYAVFMSTDVKTEGGEDITRPADLVALLSDSAPTDADLAAQWPKYAPLRAYLASAAIDPATVLNATVFTVGQPQDVTERLAAAVAGAAPPAVSSWTRCDTGVSSPCPDATGARACGAADLDFDELHALVTLPIYQEGTIPYETVADGGDISVDGGDPVQTGTQEVCLSLTVPKGAPPGGAWPTLVYAHGTGGHFRTHVVNGVADDFAVGVDDGHANVIKAAVLGIDQVAHGPRRNGSTLEPEDLFFNFANHHASRGYPRQGAADQMSLLRLVPTISFDAGSSPTGTAFALGGPIGFWGHSQGATLGAIAVPYGSWAGVLFSGQGASLREAMVTKTSPVNIAGIVPWVLSDARSDGTLQDGAAHPVLTWLQTYIDPADPVAYSRLAVSEPPAGPTTARHMFQPFGHADTFTPEVVQATYAAGAGLEVAAHDGSVSTPYDIGWPPPTPTPTPIAGNRDINGTVVTAAVRQYAPASGDDGHYVVFDVANARADAERFMAGVLGGAMPVVGQ